MKKLRLSVLIIAALALVGAALFVLLHQANKQDYTDATDTPVTPGDSDYAYSTVPLIENGTILTIRASTQGQAGDLRIGAGFTRITDHVDDSGVQQNGPVAGLWIYVRGDDSKDKIVTLYLGQRVEVDKYAITAEDITVRPSGPAPGSGGGSVRLRIDQLPSNNGQHNK